MVTLAIATKLLDPELPMPLGNPEIPAALMGVPKTAVNQDHGPASADDKVGAAWQTRDVQAEPDATAKQPLPDDEFGLRILAANAAHHC
jgi:hypothetical protein